MTVEFSWLRSQLYKECLQEYPQARAMDLEIMKTFLDPQLQDTILEIGAWSGFFSGKIADACKQLYVSDPSKEQLEAVQKLNRKNISFVLWGAENFDIPEKSVDSIWSFLAFHHCFNKTKAFANFQKALKPWGKLVIVDVLSGSSLAKHFDDKVSKYSITGHEVSFLTEEYFSSLCFGTDRKDANVVVLEDVQRRFESEEDIWKYLYKLHAMTKTTPEECLKSAKDILWIEKIDSGYGLNRPLAVFQAIKE